MRPYGGSSIGHLNDVHRAVRRLSSRPGFTAVAVLTIALGLGGATAVFSAVDAVLLRPLPYQQPGQLVRIYAASVQQPDARGFVSPVAFLAYRDPSGTMQGIAATQTYDETGADIGSGDDVRRVRTLEVSAEYFDVLRAAPVMGRGFTREEEDGPPTDQGRGAPVVVLSHGLWHDWFHADPRVLGRTLVMSGLPYSVVGVMPVGFADPISGPDIDAWVPLDLASGRIASQLGNHWLTLIGRLQPGTSIAQAHAALDGATEHLTASLTSPSSSHRDDRTNFLPLKDDVVGSASRALELLFGAVGLVLLLVCVNVANLQLVRGSERRQEFAVRSALGAAGGRMMRQLLGESLVLAAAGAVAGLGVAFLAMRGLERLGAASIPRLGGMALDVRVLLFAAAAATASAVLFGMAPAWRAARTDPADVLRGAGRANTSDRAQGHVRRALVVAQVALAFVLLAGAGVLVASYRAVTEEPLGFDDRGVLAFRVALPGARYDSLARAGFYERFDARLAALPGVQAAAGISWLPATGDHHNWDAHAVTGPLAGSPEGDYFADNRVITPDYFRALGIPLLAGRSFDAGDVRSVPDRIIVSTSLAERLFPGTSALGQQVRSGGRVSTVIGVVPDVATNMEGRTAPYIYRAHAQFAGDRNWALFEVVATKGAAAARPMALMPAIRRQLVELDPQLVADRPALLGDVVGRGMAQRKFTLLILLTFAGTALVLAALGIFGTLSYVVRLRGPEFGIQLALGASPRTILGGVLRQGAVVTGAGILLGLAAAAALSRVLASMVFHVRPLDPPALVAAALVLGLCGGVAAYLPARRAALADPKTALE
jgi:putative ABC transport system permease protein